MKRHLLNQQIEKSAIPFSEWYIGHLAMPSCYSSYLSMSSKDCKGVADTSVE
jgi:hypothetical protein